MGCGDHIVIPKSILKRYCGNYQKLSCLDLRTNTSKEVTPDSVFTSKKLYNVDKYYAPIVDKYIRDNVETTIGELYSIISTNDSDEIRMNNEFLSSMEKIFYIQSLRNNTFLRNESKRQLKHNLSLYSLFLFLEGKKIEEELQNIFSDMRQNYKMYKPGIVKLRNTKRTFIISSSQFVRINVKGNETYIFPIGPTVALLWMKYNTNTTEFPFGIISDDSAVKFINNQIIKEELNLDCDNKVFGTHSEIKTINNELLKGL